MQISDELKRLLADLPDDFFGNVELAIQNGCCGVVKVTETHKLTGRASRDHREHDGRNRHQA